MTETHRPNALNALTERLNHTAAHSRLLAWRNKWADVMAWLGGARGQAGEVAPDRALEPGLAHRGFTLRDLTADEIAQLQAQGNEADDWRQVKWAIDTALPDPEAIACFRHNHFEGRVILTPTSGRFNDADGRTWRRGIRQSVLSRCWVGHACIEHVDRLENQIVGDDAVLAQTSRITCAAGQTFGLGLRLHPGDETGSRSLWLWEGLDLDACSASLNLIPAEQERFAQRIHERFGDWRSDFGSIGDRARIVAAREVQDCWIGEGTAIEGASRVKGCALFSEPDRASRIGVDARIADAWVHAGAEVDAGGSVTRSLLLEASGVGESGKVAESVLGPNTHVEKGEITASLVGPFVGLHHQSLLISALWPEGRGNVAYGANVGSNHTGKKPDQEIRPGEGLFFGLGCTIKFPADFSDAPYSLIASGVTTLPQRVGYPFSLIMQPTFAPTDKTQGLGEIRPGFMWSENLYALARNAFKFKDRDKSRIQSLESEPVEKARVRDGFFSGRLFDASLSIKIASAYQHLSGVEIGDQELLLPSASKRLGKNAMRTASVPQALKAYREYLHLVLLRWGVEPAIWQDASLREEKCGPSLRALGLPEDSSWRDQLADYRPLLVSLPAAVAQSLERDHRRGCIIMDDYARFHGPAANDSVVKRVEQSVQALDALIR